MRGRVSAVNAVFIGSSNELGEFESGVTARLFGAVPAVVLGGVGSILVVLAVAWGWPSVRRLGALHEAAGPGERGDWSAEGAGPHGPGRVDDGRVL
jgi:hypothetical protein